jgi:hypothetical protein
MFAVLWETDHDRLLSDQADMDRNVTYPGVHSPDKGDIVRIGVHDLSIVNGNILATMGAKQFRQQAKERMVFTLPFTRLGRSYCHFKGRSG